MEAGACAFGATGKARGAIAGIDERGRAAVARRRESPARERVPGVALQQDPHEASTEGGRLELRIGARVDAVDGSVGHLRRVILGPARRQVVGLVVRVRLLPPHDVVVPATLVGDATDERIVVDARREDVLRLPGFVRADYVVLPGEADAEDAALASIHGTVDEPAHGVGLRGGEEAWALDGPVGPVDLLLLDARGRVSHFVIRKGRLLGRDVIVPVDWIRDIDERVVHLATVRAALDRLPPYRSDADLAADVAGALEKDPVVRALDIDAIDATVRDGVVTLRGHATTPESRARAEEVARDVPGVLRVENRIVSDDEIR